MFCVCDIFRNYLEHIADSIAEWTQEEEAKYQAHLLAEEVEHINKEAQEAASRPNSGEYLKLVQLICLIQIDGPKYRLNNRLTLVRAAYPK